VMCRPSGRGSCEALTTGIGLAGLRVSALSRKRRSTSRCPEGIEEVLRLVLWNAPARYDAERFIRSRRAPAGRPPIAAFTPRPAAARAPRALAAPAAMASRLSLVTG